MSKPNRYNEEECMAVFDQIFPHGFSGPDVIEELAPDGWRQSPLAAVFHPSAEQVYSESLRMHENLQLLRRADDNRPAPPPPQPPSRDEMAADVRPETVDTDREIRELVAMCTWDLFSDGHEVVDADGRVVDLGSFRASGGFIADWWNRRIGHAEYDYIDFYLGTIWVSQRADLTPVYQLIFRRLQALHFDWTYCFPRLHLVDLRPLKDALNAGKNAQRPEWENYDPSQAFADEQQENERQQQLAELRTSLDEAHREAVDEARQAPPPNTVAAYRSVYGRFPQGWPPECDA
jgi:hypothetical protein